MQNIMVKSVDGILMGSPRTGSPNIGGVGKTGEFWQIYNEISYKTLQGGDIFSL